MNSKLVEAARDAAPAGETEGASSMIKKPYEAPRVEKRRSVARVTLLSGMGQMGVGVIMGMAGM
jgi:hypothetical protein